MTGISSGTYLVGANASATADFGVGTVSFSTTNTQISAESPTLGAPIAHSDLDLTATALPITRTATSNYFLGSVTTTSSTLSGQIQGGFYGPPATSGDFAPPEAGGSLTVSNGTDQNMVGSFALKKQ